MSDSNSSPPVDIPKELETILVPINLDAFVLHEKVCEGGDNTHIIPIQQPNYVSLRLDNSSIQHDVLPTADLHRTKPATVNSRISKGFTGGLKPLLPQYPVPDKGPHPDPVFIQSRLGVYIHWSLPRGYRSGQAKAPPPMSAAQAADLVGKPASANAPTQPTFLPVPNRWVVIRVLNEAHLTPGDSFNIDERQDRYKVFVVESDVLRRADELGLEVDLETDVSPFVYFDPSKDPTSKDQKDLLTQQGEVFIGKTSSLDDGWTDNDKVPNPSGKANKINLSVMQSSNPFFADYQHHNASVFSMKDTLEVSGKRFLWSAKCDYLVCGYHSDPVAKDPFNQNGLAGTLDSRLKAFFLNNSSKAKARSGESTAFTNLVFHGAIKSVVYDRSQRPSTPADAYAQNFTGKVDMEPVSIGTTPLESAITFLQAHQKDTDLENKIFTKPEDDSGTASNTTAITAATLANQVVELATLLYASEADSYDSRVRAQDLISAQNFGRGTLSGSVWVYDKKKESGNSPAIPSQTPDSNGMSEIDYLARLNELQDRLDTATRAFDLQRWSLFAQFFNYCSDPQNFSDNKRKMYRQNIETCRDATTGLQKFVETDKPRDMLAAVNIQKQIDDILGLPLPPRDPNDSTKFLGPLKPVQVPARKVAADPFYTRSDPTLFLAGLSSGWPKEYLQNVDTRIRSELDRQTINQSLVAATNRLPDSSPRELLQKLLSEANQPNTTAEEDLRALGIKSWAGQPFCPLFVEWEAIYYNVPFQDNWDIELASSPSTNNHKTVRYVNSKKLFEGPLQKQILNDTRTLSGRIPVLPQPSFSLAAVVAQVLSSTPAANLPTDLQDLKTDDKKRRTFLENIQNLDFISGQMTGVTDGLLTLVTGQHVKPNVRAEGQATKPMYAAIQATEVPIGMAELDYRLIGDQTAKTPYGNLVNFSSAGSQPFKSVTHGQLAITKIVVVDKFGQAISAPGTTNSSNQIPANYPQFVYPCLSDQLCPTVLTDKSTPTQPKDYLNTVYHATNDAFATSSNYPVSPFIQLTPAINQDARINAAFMKRAAKTPWDATLQTPWRATLEWENPIFGWVIVNYADTALQVFTGDGIFYTEIRIGGPNGTIESPHYLPFVPPENPKTLASPQLVEFISKMRDVSYMMGVWDMITRGIETMPFPPSDYAAYANAIVGKPLALVNIGWSLELAQPPLTAQHTIGPRPGQPNIPDEVTFMNSYEFHVKIGDHERPFDGLLGYYDVGNKDVEDSTTPKLALGATDWDNLYSYYAPKMTDAEGSPEDEIKSAGDNDPRKPLLPSSYPKLTPYFIDPTKYNQPAEHATVQSGKKMIKMCIVDPYTPVHLYSAILPIKSLQLSSWTVQAAFKNMTAFFSASVLLKKDVPKSYDDKKQVHPDTWLQQQNNPTVSSGAAQVKIAISGGKGLWNWLQPYPPAPDSTAADNTKPTPMDSTSLTPTDTTRPVPRYNVFDVQNEDGAFADNVAPFTIVDGFLQLARPLIDGPKA